MHGNGDGNEPDEMEQVVVANCGVENNIDSMSTSSLPSWEIAEIA